LKRGAAAEAPMIKDGDTDYGLEKGARRSPWRAVAMERPSTFTAA
jgi:hypothetical protein